MNPNIINKYKSMIEKLNILQEEKKKIDWEIKKIKENIDEFEINNLLYIKLDNLEIKSNY